MKNVKIGVFDSGVGGRSVANAIEKAFPDNQVIFVNDVKNVPYGTKTKQQLHKLVLPILSGLVEDGCEVIVIACNTITTNLIEELRNELTVPLIGIEPMVKVAAEKTNTNIIAVCATPSTLNSSRYDWLKQAYAKDLKVIEPDCSNWSSMIEDNKINADSIKALIDDCCSQGADVFVLGCTHYHWIESDINEITKDRALVIQPEEAIISRLKTVIAEL